MHIAKKFREVLEVMDSPVAQNLLVSNNTENGDYLNFRSGFMTYTKPSVIAAYRAEVDEGKNKEERTNPWNSHNRVRVKPSKGARKFVSTEFTDAEYEYFHNELVSYSFSIKQFRLLKGDDITRAYNDWYDTRKQSRSGQSCMTGANPNTFELYTRNPQSVRLLTLWDRFQGEDVIIARALLWKTDKGPYLDRIYAQDMARPFVERYARNKGWLTFSSYRDIPHHMVVSLDHSPEQYPYLDSFFDASDTELHSR